MSREPAPAVDESTFIPGRLERDVVLGSLVRHSVPGVERIDLGRGTVARLIRDGATVSPVTVRVRDDGIEVAGARSTSMLESIREWFDLDTDIDAVDAHLGRDATLKPLVAARPALRVIGHPDAFELAVQTVLGQQVSLAACRTFTGRLAAAYGGHGPSDLIEFPDAATIAAAEHDELRSAVGIPAARAATVVRLAETIAEGLTLSCDADPKDVRTRLLALPGIGPWTVDYLALRALKDADAYPVGDLVLRRALGGVTAAEALRLGEGWRPWRAYATMHLWISDAAGVA